MLGLGGLHVAERVNGAAADLDAAATGEPAGLNRCRPGIAPMGLQRLESGAGTGLKT
jgi:hypothetical protein